MATRSPRDAVITGIGLISPLAERFRTQSSAHWLGLCVRESVPAGAVKDVPDALASPTVIERGVIQTLAHPYLDEVRMLRPAHGLVAQQEAEYKAPPLLGQDSAAVLAQVLGYDAARIGGLQAAGAIAQYEPPGE